ncbi:unnamed protein product [Oreochromis niloticus]|nr:unnamed protein product [Mustela putorius furo]
MASVTVTSCWKSLLLVALMDQMYVQVSPLSTVPSLLNLLSYDQWMISISGPDTVFPGQLSQFTCLTSCSLNVECTVTWEFRGGFPVGTYLSINKNVVKWTPSLPETFQTFTCIAENKAAGRSAEATKMVEVKVQISVQVSPINTVPSLNQSLNLICHDARFGDPQGLSDLVWYKDGQKVTLRENMWLQQNNLTLHFDSLLPSDAGFYQCQTYLPTSQTRVVSLGYLLSYDQWNISISGPDTVFPGQLSEFTCLTSCSLNVECTVTWEFRGRFPVGPYFSITKNVVKWTPSLPETFQNFTCIAENKAAGRSAEATKMVEVKDIPISGSEAMQLSGLFAGILSLGLWVL